MKKSLAVLFILFISISLASCKSESSYKRRLESSASYVSYEKSSLDQDVLEATIIDDYQSLQLLKQKAKNAYIYGALQEWKELKEKAKEKKKLLAKNLEKLRSYAEANLGSRFVSSRKYDEASNTLEFVETYEKLLEKEKWLED